MNALKSMSWHEWLEINEWKHMNSQEWPETLSFLFLLINCLSSCWWFCWHLKPSSRYSLPDRGTQPRKQRPETAATTATSPEKNIEFRARECFQAWIREISRSLTLPNYSMMMWLTWWLRWWCHDGETASHDNRLWLGSFRTKLPLHITLTWSPIKSHCNETCPEKQAKYRQYK